MCQSCWSDSVSKLSSKMSQFQHRINNKFMCKLGEYHKNAADPARCFEYNSLKKLPCLTGTCASKASKTAGRWASHLETFNFWTLKWCEGRRSWQVSTGRRHQQVANEVGTSHVQTRENLTKENNLKTGIMNGCCTTTMPMTMTW